MSRQLQFRVTAELGLNLRTEPVVKASTRKAVLPHGQLVTKIQEADGRWWLVATTLQGVNLEGYVSKRYLTPVDAFEAPESHSSITAVHLRTSSPVRRNGTAWAFPLNERGQPARDPAAGTAAKRRALGRIVDWLDVESSVRYKRRPGSTYCNIYAYDYCYLAGVYMPRVWWTAASLLKLRNGTAVVPKYGETVVEMNANSLFVWYRDFGERFGWRRVFDLTELQAGADDGRVAIITAQHKIPNRSGHICAVVPETSTHEAVRRNGVVTKPLQSQAGATNHGYRAWVWWTTSQFKDFAFYLNA